MGDGREVAARRQTARVPRFRRSGCGEKKNTLTMSWFLTDHDVSMVLKSQPVGSGFPMITSSTSLGSMAAFRQARFIATI